MKITPENIEEVFEKYDDEYLKFDRVEDKSSLRPDLHAFMLLDSLLPKTKQDIVAASEYEQIYLGVDLDELAEVVTEEQIRDLCRCGVRYDSETDGLAMFA